MKSIIQKDKECFICRSRSQLQEHHVFFGNPGRKHSEKYGMKVWLCMDHHTGDNGVHFNRDMDLYVKRCCQRVFEEKKGSRAEFRKIFGKSYL